MDFSRQLLNWYNKNKRDLPWRRTKDPYKIWVSEIILQQTRVNQGHDYYLRFLERFPDVKALSDASEEDVLSVWRGLGYYSRARNMHLAAKQVSNDFNGRFPSDYHNLLKLKGIGTYTAAAISSICGNEPNPVVDGNVIRVFSRLAGITEPAGSILSFKKVFDEAKSLISHENPGDFNQAVMEFGAIACKPVNPLCIDCIFNKECFAFNNNLVDQLPAKKAEVIRRNRYLNYLCIVLPGNRMIMTKRLENDIWKNLWELPLVESDRLFSTNEILRSELWRSLIGPESDTIYNTMDFRHILTHQVIYARFFIVNADKIEQFPSDPDTIVNNPLTSRLPVSRLIERFLQKAEL